MIGRATTCLAIVAASLLAAGPASAQMALLPGVVRNVSDRCGAAGPIVVQLLGANLSPRFELDAGQEARTSLSQGLYNVAVSRADGTLVEESLVRVEEGGFRLLFGCPGAQGASDLKSEPVKVRLANTTPDCGRPYAVDFVVNGGSPVTVAPGRTVDARVPASEALFEGVVAGKRAWSMFLPRVREDRTIFFGCTDPEAIHARGGETLAFENTTNACTDPAQVRHVTLWVDGLPVVGLGPGSKVGVNVSLGRHVFEVHGGMTRERLLRGEKDVAGPFRIRFGCGK